MQQDVIVMVKRVTAFLVVLLAAALPVRAQTGVSDESEADIRYVLPEEQAGQSMATVAVEDRPLAHTEQFMALEAGGRILAPGEASAQAEKVLEKIGRALGAVGAGMESVLKLNVYAASNATAGEVRSYFAERYGGTEEKPAVSYVVTALPHPKALVAMDAVAAVPAGSEASRAEEQRTVRRVEGLRMSGGGPERGHVAVMPGGGNKIYVSGQVAKGKPVAAMRTSLEHMHDRLAYLGLSADDVVQVKVFADSIANATRLEAKIAEYYRKKPSPPVVMVEWTHPGADVEVELIATRGPTEATTDETITYPVPPGLKAFPTYSRVAEIHQGDILYVSGLYGTPSEEAEGQMRDIFATLGQVLERAGTDFDHLAKATYYLNSWDVKGPLWGIRKEFYDPERPPTSSLIPVRGVGKEGRLVTIDMVGVVPE
jgi:enamine deaminase RidA (YjgF/YER057c/UK114 family)